jgi:hypothetical protein
MGFYIPEDDIFHSHRRENLKSYILMFFQTANNICKTLLDHQRVQELVRNNNNFDLIITKILGPNCMNVFSYRFDVQIISMTSSVILPWGNDHAGNPDHPGCIPNYILP